MDKLWRRIRNRKKSSKSSSDKNATQNKSPEPDPARNKPELLGNTAKRFDFEDVMRASEPRRKGFLVTRMSGTTSTVSKGTEDTSSWLNPSAQVDRHSQLYRFRSSKFSSDKSGNPVLSKKKKKKLGKWTFERTYEVDEEDETTVISKIVDEDVPDPEPDPEPDPARNLLVLLGNFANRFDFEDVLSASKKVLGKGTFATTYEAYLEAGTTRVILKRLEDVVLSAEDFRDKVEAIGAMDHENLLPLRGYFFSKDMKFLLYDYMPQKSLSNQLHAYKLWGWHPLSWEVRLSIALGAAQAIEHLHAHGIHHGDIKLSNILITPSYKAQVSDYGLAALTRSALGGGDDPAMADVYGFGLLLLELLTGKLHTLPLQVEEGVDLTSWVQSVCGGSTAEAVNVELMSCHGVEDGVYELLGVATSCVSPNSHERPQMSEVRRKIEELCSPGGQQDWESQLDKVSEGTEDTSSWLIPSAQVDRDSQLDQFSQVNNDMYTGKQPDRVLNSVQVQNVLRHVMARSRDT